MATGRILYKSLIWKIFQTGLTFLINLFLSRHFESSISAEFYNLIYLLSLFASFFTLGLDISLNYYLSRRQISSPMACRIIAGVTVLALLFSLPLLALLFRPGRYPDLSTAQWIFFGGCHIAGVLLTNLSGTVFTAYGQNYRPSQYSFVVNLVLAVLLCWKSWYLSGYQLVENLFFLYFSFSFLQGLFLFLLVLLGIKGKAAEAGRQPAPPPAGLHSILRFSLVTFVTNFVFFAGSRLCIYLLPYWVGTAEQGNYIQAFKLVEYLGLIASFLYYPFIALVAGDLPTSDTSIRPKQKEQLLLLLVRLSNTAVLAFSIVMLIVGKELLPFVYGHSFDRMYDIFIWFIPGLFPVCSSTFFTAWFYGAGQPKYNLISGCIQLLATFGLFFLFTGAWGAQGASFAFSLASLASMAFDCIIFRRTNPYKLGELLLMRRQDLQVVRVFIRRLSGQAGKE